MPNTTLSSDIRHYAIVGAEARLLQLSQETETIHRLFPELRNGAAQKAVPAGASAPRPPRRDRRHTMSAAERNAVSERMKKYWAARRGGSADGITSSDSPTKAAKPTRGTAKRGPRTMSSEARKRISDAQKARWAKQRGEAKGAEKSSGGAVSPAVKGRRATKRRGRGAGKRGPRKVSSAARKRMSEAQKKRWAAKRARA